MRERRTTICCMSRCIERPEQQQGDTYAVGNETFSTTLVCCALIRKAFRALVREFPYQNLGGVVSVVTLQTTE